MKVVRHSKNPFTDNMTVPMTKKNVRLSRLGGNDNVLIDQVTGEHKGTHVTTYKKVDSEQFVKLFSANIAMTFDLTSAGIKAFNVLVWTVQNRAIEKDLIPLDKLVVEEFIAFSQDRRPPIKLSMGTFW